MILGQIANPQMADIAGALDIRQKRIDADEKKRKDIRMRQLVAEAIPGLRDGSPLKQLAMEDTEKFALITKVLGIPLNSGDKLQAFSDEIRTLNAMAKADPRQAFYYAMSLQQDRKDQGIEDSNLDKWVSTVQENPEAALKSLDMMDRSLNGESKDGFTLGEGQTRYDAKGNVIASAPVSDATRSSQATSDQKNWEQYQKLLKEDPEAAARFGRSAGFETTEGEKLSAFAEKQLAEASDEYTTASGASSRYMTLADKLRKSSMSGGLTSTWGEYLKEQSGNQDEITALRKEALAISNSEAIKNLPPGPATDRDIQIVMAPFPTEKADPKYVANWLESMSRLNQKRAEFAEFKSDFIGKNGSLRDKQGNSLTRAWKSAQESKAPEAKVDTTKQGGQIMVDAKGNRAMVYPDGTFEEMP